MNRKPCDLDKVMESTPRRRKSKSLVYGFGINDCNHITSLSVEGRTFNHSAYSAWANMLKRCYCHKYKAKHPTYEMCNVSAEWLSFSNFKSWWNVNHVEGWHLDKDLLVTDNKTYGQEFCIYIPMEINELTIASNSSRGGLPLGVHWDDRKGRFISQINLFGKRRHIGNFLSAIDAHEAWYAEKINYAQKFRDLCDSIDLRLFPGVMRKIESLRDKIPVVKLEYK